jgi:carbamoyl-phosphate synthase large subunit
LVQFFKEALAGRGSVFAADMSPMAPALTIADGAFELPPVDHDDYIADLVELCRRIDVRLLVPLNDLELPVLARNADSLRAADVIPVVSLPDVVDICRDKLRSEAFLDRHGLCRPASFTTVEAALDAVAARRVSFPLVVKPQLGSASVGFALANDDAELRATHTRALIAANGKAVIQERLRGVECGLDVVNDLQGRYVATLARRKVAMRAGETDQAVTVHDARLERVGRLIGEALGHVGCLDCDVFVDGDRVTVLDMNPRFGGGYPFSHAAGADLPAALIAWASGEAPDRAWLRQEPGVAGAKYTNVAVAKWIASACPEDEVDVAEFS